MAASYKAGKHKVSGRVLVTGSSGEGTKFFGPAAQTARLMLYGLLAVVLMAMDQRGHYVPRVRSVVEYLVEPVYHIMEWPVRAMRNVYGQFQSRRSLRHENEDLRVKLLSQRGALQRLETLAEENRRLRALIEGAKGQAFEFQFAELLRVDLDPFSHKVMVDRGSSDGVEIGQAVIDGAGVMGLPITHCRSRSTGPDCERSLLVQAKQAF
jgi:rod shape-determining protein MreC